jgi:hypothetical protein
MGKTHSPRHLDKDFEVIADITGKDTWPGLPQPEDRSREYQEAVPNTCQRILPV